MSMRLFVRIAAVLCALPLLAGCAELDAINAQIEHNRAMNPHPLGPLGPGLDMYLAGEQIRAIRGR